MILTAEQIAEVQQFQHDLGSTDEWLFWNMSALRAIKEGGPVTYEDKYETMLRWKSLKRD